MLRSFRELSVWQKSTQLATTVYRLTQGFPREEIYGLSSQLRRAAVAIPSNIAEGQGRLNLGEYRQFLGIARGSNFELQTQLEIARSLGMGNLKLTPVPELLCLEAIAFKWLFSSRKSHLAQFRKRLQQLRNRSSDEAEVLSQEIGKMIYAIIHKLSAPRAASA